MSLVVPLYNEESAIPELAKSLRTEIPQLSARYGIDFALIFVDDGSADATVETLGQQALPVPAELILLSRNFGKEAALTAGVEAADPDADAVVLMDADLQHPPALIGPLIEEWLNGFEVVYYYKQDRNKERWTHRLGSAAFYRMTNEGKRFSIPQNAGDFRLLDRAAINAFNSLPERERFLKGLYAWIGFRQKGLPFEVPDRVGGAGSRFSSNALVNLALDGLTAFSMTPLRMITAAGFVICALTAIYICWVIFERLFLGTPFPGFASIVVLISFFGGAQLLALGVLGEYVGRTLMESKQRPVYLIRERITLNDD